MATYGLKYFCDFVRKGDSFRIAFEFKDYTGGPAEVFGGAAPCVHKWSTDDPFAVIRGSSLDLTILTRGGISIADFFTNEDDGIRVTLTQGAGVLAQHFLVLDDFTEPVVEYLHEFTMITTDNLALLKDIKFDEAAALFGTVTNMPVEYIAAFDLVTTGDPYINFPGTTALAAGSTIIITGTSSPLDNMPFTIVTSLVVAGLVENQVLQSLPVTGFFNMPGISIEQIATIDQTGVQSFAKIIAVCLNATGVQLNSHVYTALSHDGAVNHVLLTTYLRIIDLKTGNDFKSCYDILQGIIGRINGLIFQARGVWQIIRWPELRYNAGTAGPGYVEFAPDFSITGSAGAYAATVDFGGGGGATLLATPQRTLQRPYRYIKETFNYIQPSVTLINANLLIFGTFLKSYTTGTGATLQTFKEYAAPFFSNGFFYNPSTGAYTPDSPANIPFIRITYDQYGDETDRYLVVPGVSGSEQARAVVGTYIEVNKGDRIEYSTSYHTPPTSGSIAATNFVIELQDNANPAAPPANRVQLRVGGFWAAGAIPPLILNQPNNAGQWDSVDQKSFEIPFDARMYIFFANPGTNTRETWFKGMSLTYFPSNAGQPNINGQTHTDTQNLTLKNNDEQDLFIDDVVSNLIQGAIFSDTAAGAVLRARSRFWNRTGIVESKRLGEITTFEKLQARSVTRTKIETDITEIKQPGGAYFSLLNSVVLDRYPDLLFIFGTLEIDYRNDRGKCTLYELYKTGETDIVNSYEFKYLYE